MSDVPEPGIYHDVPPEVYFGWDAISNSRLSLMAKSPLHYKHSPRPSETSAMRLGTLTHAGRLEPLSIAEQYAVMPDYHLEPSNVTDEGERSKSKSTNHYKHKVAAFLDANQGKKIVTAKEYQSMKQLVAALCRDAKAVECINGEGPVEVSIVWVDSETGLLCKARIDKVNRDNNRLVDLKTSGNIFTFQKSIYNYGYDRQMAHYQDGWATLNGGELLDPWLVPVSSDAPPCVMAAPLGASSLEAGRADRDEYMRQVKECIDKDCWPGPEAPESWERPEWSLERQPRITETDEEIIAI